jgi:hypothetical protein
MDIQQLLKEYRVSKAKIRMAELEIEQLTDLLRQGTRVNTESTAEVIEAMILGRTSDPGSTVCSGRVSSPTENVAMTYLIEWAKEPPAAAEIRTRVADIRSAIYGLSLGVRMVDRALEALNEREKWVIENLYLEGLSWRMIQENFAGRFEDRDERTLKRYRREGLNKMDEVMRT